MTENLSFKQVLDGVVSEDDVDGLQNLVLQHKNWGAFSCKVPSYIIVNLIDTIRLLREHGAKYYVTSEGRPCSLDSLDDEPTPEELVDGYTDELEDT